MPWTIKQQGDRHCVVDKNGKTLKCYASKSKARSYQKALYANSKEFSEMPLDLLTLEDRKKLPENVFADPERRLWPIRHKEDYAAATAQIAKLGKIGKPLLTQANKIARGLGLSVSFSEDDEDADDDEDEEFAGDEFTSDLILFDRSNSFRDGDYVVYPQRKLFPAGWYESHNYGMTPEELLVAAQSCFRAPYDIEHKTSIIKDEYMGYGANFTSEWEGNHYVMRTDAYIHHKLDPLLKDETKMSATWSKANKSLVKIALTLNPRIPDTDVKQFTEFAKGKTHQTYSGQQAIQTLHDKAVQGGAVCSGDNADMASKTENKAIQKVHDDMVAEGAKCESLSSSRIYNYYTDDAVLGTLLVDSGLSGFAGVTLVMGKDHPQAKDAVQRIHDASVKVQSDKKFSSETKLSKDVQVTLASLIDLSESDLAGLHDTAVEYGASCQCEAKPTKKGESMSKDGEATMSDVQKQLDEANRRLNEMAQEARTNKASTFVNGLVADALIDPKLAQPLTQFAAQLLADDETAQTEIAFSDTDKKSRFGSLEALFTTMRASQKRVLPSQETIKLHNPNEKLFALGEGESDEDGGVADRVKARARKHMGVTAAANGKGGN